MSKVTVVTEAVRAEARKWKKLSDQAAPVKVAADGLTLAQTAFFIGDANAAIHAQVYASFQGFMANILSGAVTEFEQLGGALDKVADAYDNADALVDLNLDKIYGA
jgi:hypothetical protein